MKYSKNPGNFISGASRRQKHCFNVKTPWGFFRGRVWLSARDWSYTGFWAKTPCLKHGVFQKPRITPCFHGVFTGFFTGLQKVCGNTPKKIRRASRAVNLRTPCFTGFFTGLSRGFSRGFHGVRLATPQKPWKCMKPP